MVQCKQLRLYADRSPWPSPQQMGRGNYCKGLTFTAHQLTPRLLNRSALLADGFDIFHQVVEVFGRNLMFIKRRHHAKADNAGSDLQFHREDRQRFVVEARAEATFAAGVTGIASPSEDDLAVLDGRIV